MRYARWDVDGEVVLARRLDDLGGTIGRAALAQVMEHDSSGAERHVPEVRLMEVVVQPDECAALAVCSVSLDHLTAARYP